VPPGSAGIRSLFADTVKLFFFYFYFFIPTKTIRGRKTNKTTKRSFQILCNFSSVSIAFSILVEFFFFFQHWVTNLRKTELQTRCLLCFSVWKLGSNRADVFGWRADFFPLGRVMRQGSHCHTGLSPVGRSLDDSRTLVPGGGRDGAVTWVD